MYLKRWEDLNKKVWKYSIFVPNAKVKLWNDYSVKGIAFHEHLYTKLIAGKESDEMEKWFNTEFESPSEDPICKVINEDRLTPEDWNKLIRFLALQDVRTPLKLIEHLKRKELFEAPFQNSLNNAVKKYEEFRLGKINLPVSNFKPNEMLNINLTKEFKTGEKTGVLKAEFLLGRNSWLYVIKRLLTAGPIKELLNHKWTIIKPAIGMQWFTSDNPIVRLNPTRNLNGIQRYDLKCGWGKSGNIIFMPISPNHLMFTTIGKKAPPRGTRFSIEDTNLIQRFIAENAHRAIFSNKAELKVEKLRPRIVDLKSYNWEKEQWEKWPEEQLAKEKEFMNRDS